MQDTALGAGLEALVGVGLIALLPCLLDGMASTMVVAQQDLDSIRWQDSHSCEKVGEQIILNFQQARMGRERLMGIGLRRFTC